MPLKDRNVTINYGIKTGYNEAFIIDKDKRAELIKTDPKSVELIRPILRGRDIKRFTYEFADQYLIATFPSKSYNIEDFPAVKRFLEGFKPKLNQTGIPLTAVEKRQVMAHAKANGIFLKEESLKIARKKTNNKWFETQDSISYWDDFSKQKIVWGNLNMNAAFAIAPEGIFINAPCPMIVPASKSLLGILNSKLADYFIQSLGVPRDGGYFEYKPMFIEQLPVPLLSKEHEIELTNHIDKIENATSKHVKSEIAKNIDILVYTIYDLTKEEIELIESQ